MFLTESSSYKTSSPVPNPRLPAEPIREVDIPSQKLPLELVEGVLHGHVQLLDALVLLLLVGLRLVGLGQVPRLINIWLVVSLKDVERQVGRLENQ